MRRVLVSSCLLGERVRFDGGAKPVQSLTLERWLREGLVVRACPELLGGLPVPRPPVELQPDGRVLDMHGVDRTAELERGAQAALALARESGVVCAVLKESSPSCGTHEVHGGRFDGVKVSGEGLAAKALREAGMRVFSEAELEEADAFLMGEAK